MRALVKAHADMAEYFRTWWQARGRDSRLQDLRDKWYEHREQARAVAQQLQQELASEVDGQQRSLSQQAQQELRRLK